MADTLQKLADIIEQRKGSDPSSSYVAKLQSSGLNKILETILAARDAEQEENLSKVVYETADLWFHSLVMLAHLNLGPQDVLEELERRFGISGLEEKASRKTS